MSRSFKKTHIVKDHTKGMKRFANKAVRNTLELSSGSSFKKVFCSYDISDYKFICEKNCNSCDKNKSCDYLRK